MLLLSSGTGLHSHDAIAIKSVTCRQRPSFSPSLAT